MTQVYKARRKKISNIPEASQQALSGGAEKQRVAPSWLVDQVGRDREVDEDLPQPAHVVAHLFREEGGVGPGLTQDLLCGEEAVGLIEEELEKLELPLGREILTLERLGWSHALDRRGATNTNSRCRFTPRHFA